ALDCGINFVDSAEMYGGGQSETQLGELLKGRRNKMVVATKFGGRSDPATPVAKGSRAYIREAVERSLARLQTDYIDLYYIHFPDARTPMLETLHTMNDLIHEGKVRYIGACNHAAWQLVDADWIAKTNNLLPFTATQNEYSLLNRTVEADIRPVALKHGLGV